MLPTAVWRLLVDAYVSQRRRCLCLFSASPRSGFALVQRNCSSSWGSVFVCGRLASSFVASNGTLQRASARRCPSGWDCGHPRLPSLPLLKFSCSCRYPSSLLFECGATDGTDARSRARGRRSSLCKPVSRRAECPHLPCVPQEKKSSRTRRCVVDKCVNAKGCRKRP